MFIWLGGGVALDPCFGVGVPLRPYNQVCMAIHETDFELFFPIFQSSRISLVCLLSTFLFMSLQKLLQGGYLFCFLPTKWIVKVLFLLSR